MFIKHQEYFKTEWMIKNFEEGVLYSECYL